MVLINVYQPAELTVIMIYITLCTCAVVLKMLSITRACEKEEKKQHGRKIKHLISYKLTFKDKSQSSSLISTSKNKMHLQRGAVLLLFSCDLKNKLKQKHISLEN